MMEKGQMAEESGRKKGKKKAKPKKQKEKVTPEEETGEIEVAQPSEPEEGRLSFAPTIITDVVQRAAREIEGVVELTGSFIDNLRPGSTRGVAVTEVGEGDAGHYDLSLKLSVEYGTDCVAIAEAIRERVADAVQRMTGRDVRRIDIHVTGIASRREEGRPSEDAGEISEEHGIDF